MAIFIFRHFGWKLPIPVHFGGFVFCWHISPKIWPPPKGPSLRYCVTCDHIEPRSTTLHFVH